MTAECSSIYIRLPEEKCIEVAVTDHIFDDLSVYRGILEDEETRVFEYQCTTEDEVIEVAHDADAILTTNYQYYTKRVIDALERCKVIVRTGIGVDSVDIEAATKKGNNGRECAGLLS